MKRMINNFSYKYAIIFKILCQVYNPGNFLISMPPDYRSVLSKPKAIDKH
jgi:hypothetical protein